MRYGRLLLLTLAAVLLVSLMPGGSDQPANASHETPGADGSTASCGDAPTVEPCVVDFVQIDTDPTGNDGDTLGSLETCREIATTGTLFSVDVIIDALPDINGNIGGDDPDTPDGSVFNQVIVRYDNDKLTLGTVPADLTPGATSDPSLAGIDPESNQGLAGYAIVSELDAGAGAAPRIVGIMSNALDDATSSEDGIGGAVYRLPFTTAAAGIAEVSVMGSSGGSSGGLSTKIVQADNNIFTIANLYGPDGNTGGAASADDQVAQSFIAIGGGANICAAADGDDDGVPDISDNCPDTTNVNQANADGDQWGDACETADCVGVATAWVTPPGDPDCDGWRTAVERVIYGVGPGSAQELAPCRTETVDDPWPPDTFGMGGLPDRVVDGQDMMAFLPVLFTRPGDPGYSARFDLLPYLSYTTIDGQDLVAMLPFLFTACEPPP